MTEFLPLLLITVAFIALIVLPMRSRNRELRRVQEFQGALRVGDPVMTSSGLYGRVTGLAGETVELEIAPGVVTTWSRMAVRETPPKPGPEGQVETGGDDQPASPRRPTTTDGAS